MGYLVEWELPAFVGVGVVYFHTFVSSLWLQKAAARLQPGLLRFMAVLPIMAINAALPFMFDSRFFKQRYHILGGILNMFTSFLVMWLANCKILAFVLNRGVLAKAQSWHFWRFYGLLLLPVLPKTFAPDTDLTKDPDASSSAVKKLKELGRLIFQFFVKLGALVLFSYWISEDYPGSPWREPLYCYGLMYLLGTAFDASQAGSLLVFDTYTIDSFNHPYLAQSLVDLWGARWNIMTGAYFRPLAYDIILSGQLVAPEEGKAKDKKPEWVRAVATIATFVLSGILHLFVFWYIANEWAWDWMLFFFIFGPLMIAERAIDGALTNVFGKDKYERIPKFIRVPLGIIYSNGGSLLLASFFFVPPIDRADIRRGAADCFYILLGRYWMDSP